MMDPKAIAGIGNIYACEILHSAGISPLRRASTLSMKEWKTIFSHAKRILNKGIEKRGTSISDWRDLYGCQGENQDELKAYGQERMRCSICGGTICRIKQGGRSTFYCPDCQK
jgi:formamidopyrimidine-DNA glycosylase